MEQSVVTFKSEKREIICDFTLNDDGELKYHVSVNPPFDTEDKEEKMDLTTYLANEFLCALKEEDSKEQE